MTLVQKYALLPDEIDRQSLVMVADSLAGSKVLNQLDERERYVLHRIVRAEGDPAIADDVRFSGNVVANALDSLRQTRRIVTDVRMVQVGISRAGLARVGVETACLIDAPEVAARAQREGTTRSVAAVRGTGSSHRRIGGSNRQRSHRTAGPPGPYRCRTSRARRRRGYAGRFRGLPGVEAGAGRPQRPPHYNPRPARG